ncbi:MAG: SRPBCC family protein [Solirubrobacteraceae bacterium]|nr:SRPBCC family protein [Solirubrobacteraceae bacterium]
MRIHVLHREQLLPGTPEEVFPFFADAANLEAITPPLLRFSIVTPGDIEMRVGTLIQYRLKLHGLPISWLTSIQRWDPPYAFVDQQIKGPYALWHHTHTFVDDGAGGTRMTDTVRYALPLSPLSEIAMPLVRRDLATIFDYRRDEVARRILAPVSA